jgi:hypothetical protein
MRCPLVFKSGTRPSQQGQTTCHPRRRKEHPAGLTCAGRLAELTHDTAHLHGIHCSLRLAGPDGRDTSGAGPLYDMKLRAALGRAAIDVPVIAGQGQLPTGAE